MDAGWRLRVKEVFVAVRGLAPAERADGLRALCGGDDRLRDEVLSLLRYDGTGDCGAQRALEGARRDSGAPRLRVGEFVLVRRLGGGGMGAVWEAEQDRPRRRVAVKILARSVASTEAQRRFEREAEFLARLHHPSIAQVYAAGTFEHEGEHVPYFAMELVEGARTLDAHARERSADLRERLRILAAVCEAVHHAHERGVIHRDLKPANILVDAAGVPKVIDFGVARAVDAERAATGLTHAGELVGTLAYMSPEQCNGSAPALDRRTDVYSLGVVLYETVCGRRPYDLSGQSISAAARTICDREPEPPRRFDPGLGSDFEAVVLRCLEKDPRRRYASAADMAAELRRILAGEPVEARRPGVLRRAARWTRRHPSAALVCACAALALGSARGLFLEESAASGLQVVRIDSGGGAVLKSSDGGILKRWTGPPSGRSIEFAALVERHPDLGGGQVVALGLDYAPRSGELCLFETSNLDEPYWTSAAAPLRLPAEEPERRGTRFVVLGGGTADVFADLPGDELIVLHRIVPYSATALRVYDLAGTVHYEAWHDGGIHTCEWLTGPRLLVAAGLSSERSWDGLGVDTSGSFAVYPAVVLALRPERGRTDFGHFVVRRGRVLDPTLAWYEWLGPAEHVAALDDVLPRLHTARGSAWESAEHVQVEFGGGQRSSMQPPPSFHLVVDAGGREVDRVVSDPYWRWERAGRLPPASAYRLCGLAELPNP